MSPSPDVSRSVLRRVFWRIVPLLFVLYVATYMDSYNIGFAQLQMKAAIGLSDPLYGLGAGLLIIGQTLVLLPSNMAVHRFGARAALIRIALAWGFGSVAMAFVSTPLAFLGVRFGLGLATSGFFTGLMLYLTYWFPDARRAQILSLFLLAPVVAGMIVGPISGTIISGLHKAGDLSGWQWMFLIEAVPCLLAAGLIYPVLSDRPEQATWLSADEKALLIRSASDGTGPDGRLKITSLRDALANPVTYVLGLVGALAQVGIYSSIFFLPVMLKEHGAGAIGRIGLLSALPYLVGGAMMIVIGRSSDRRGERRWHCVASLLIAAVGFVIIGASRDLATGLAGMCLMSGGLLATLVTFWTLPPRFAAGAAAAGSMAVISILAESGGAFAPFAVGTLRATTGDLSLALFAVAALLVSAAVILLFGMPAEGKTS